MILESRSQEAARRVLDGYRGIVIADGYGAYDALARAGPASRWPTAGRIIPRRVLCGPARAHGAIGLDVQRRNSA
jgi:hypothetical protein